MEDRNGSKTKDVTTGEVAPRATRRTFTREYKLRIVREAAEAKKNGGVGALLFREGSTATTWWPGDEDVIPFYQRFGLFAGRSMMRRKYS